MLPFLYQSTNFLCQMLWYVSDLPWRNFRRYRAKGLWFKWRPNVCIWIAIPQWQSFYFSYYEFSRMDFLTALVVMNIICPPRKRRI